jgi:hypothetical protein
VIARFEICFDCELAYAVEAIILRMILQALNDLGVPILHVAAKLFDGGCAFTLHQGFHLDVHRRYGALIDLGMSALRIELPEMLPKTDMHLFWLGDFAILLDVSLALSAPCRIQIRIQRMFTNQSAYLVFALVIVDLRIVGLETTKYHSRLSILPFITKELSDGKTVHEMFLLSTQTVDLTSTPSPDSGVQAVVGLHALRQGLHLRLAITGELFLLVPQALDNTRLSILFVRTKLGDG